MIQKGAEQDALARAGCLAFPGFRLQALDVTTSTQDVVRVAARSGAAAGFCCTADSQSSGRGRQQRAWSAPPRSSLLASILVRAGHPGLGLVPLATGLALRAAIEASSGAHTLLKWPNDILADGRKLAGILCEVEPAAAGAGTAVVIGMGVNLHVDAFPDAVAGISLHELVTEAPTPARLLAHVLPELAARLALLEGGGTRQVCAEWMEHAAGIGSSVTATSAAGTVSGTTEGIDDDGALLVRGASGTVRVLAGDVHIEPLSSGPGRLHVTARGD